MLAVGVAERAGSAAALAAGDDAEVGVTAQSRRRRRDADDEAANARAFERLQAWRSRRDDERFVSAVMPYLDDASRRRAAQVRLPP